MHGIETVAGTPEAAALFQRFGKAAGEGIAGMQPLISQPTDAERMRFNPSE